MLFWINYLNLGLINKGNFYENGFLKKHINDKLKEEGNASNVLGGPLNSLLWVINKLSLNGEPLLKGNVVSTGTCTVAIPLEKNYSVKVDFADMGNIDFQFN